MSAQPVKVCDITDESSAQTYLDQMIMTTFCRVLDTSRLSPTVVMRLMAAALGKTYREVSEAHLDGQCPCGWLPLPSIDIGTLRASLEEAAAPQRPDGLATMTIVGRA
ncbi:MAG: hypothetical protein JWQ94_442 [Tardiphaga sp.]|jgi:hypothetical protein|nr:hypothetical protein [Tardiphaga sp.]